MTTIQDYVAVTGDDVIDPLRQLARPLRGKKVAHVNSTYVGGGVAEILSKLAPLQKDLGLDVRGKSFEVKRHLSNPPRASTRLCRAYPSRLGDGVFTVYEETGAQNSEELRSILEEADTVITHDPQPLPLLRSCPNRKGKWIWRCHIDLSHPYRPLGPPAMSTGRKTGRSPLPRSCQG